MTNRKKRLDIPKENVFSLKMNMKHVLANLLQDLLDEVRLRARRAKSPDERRAAELVVGEFTRWLSQIETPRAKHSEPLKQQQIEQ